MMPTLTMSAVPCPPQQLKLSTITRAPLPNKAVPRTNKSPHRCDVVGLARYVLRVDALSGRRHVASTSTPRGTTSRSSEGRLRMDSRHRKHGPIIEATGQRVKSSLAAAHRSTATGTSVTDSPFGVLNGENRNTTSKCQHQSTRWPRLSTDVAGHGISATTDRGAPPAG